MRTGIQSPRNAQQVSESFGHERMMQPMADAFYTGRGHVVETRKGTQEFDLVLLTKGNRRELIEEKFRGAVWDDVLVEIVQDLASGDLGWLYHCQSDYLHYFMCPNWQYIEAMYRIKWQPFRKWLIEEYMPNRRLKFVISRQGYGLTLNISVPLRDIPDDLKQRPDIEGAA